MDLRILGPLEVRHDGAVLPLTGSKPRALLCLMCLNVNRPVRADELIEQLWNGRPPSSAATALRVHIAKLRRVLDVGRAAQAPSARLPAVPGGYLLRLEPDELDAQRFERLLAAARDANASGVPSSAVDLATAALDLWRGPPLDEIHDLTVGGPEITRLNDLWAAAIEELADARLALGQAALVTEVLGAALERHPLRERITWLLMVAFYTCGRQADALSAYSQLARRLDQELGVQPSPELRQLEEDILLQRPLRHAALLDSARPSNSRRTGTRLIGRRTELTRLRRALQPGRAGRSTTCARWRPRRCRQDDPGGTLLLTRRTGLHCTHADGALLGTTRDRLRADRRHPDADPPSRRKHSRRARSAVRTEYTRAIGDCWG